MGRISTYDQAIADEISERLSSGEPLASICRDEKMPAVRTVSDWKVSHGTFAADFVRAREEGFDQIAADTLTIADDSRNDYIDKLAADGDEQASFVLSNGEHIQRSKLRIETRLRLLAKWHPKRYGDRVETVMSNPDGTGIFTGVEVKFVGSTQN